jgi:rare lipoprotein A (peptidoglycan hydrolase)
MRFLFLFVLLTPCVWSQRLLGTGSIGMYDRSYQGTTLRNGERFDGSQLVAGHPSLPIGAFVTVLNPATNRSVKVRIVQNTQTHPNMLFMSEAAVAAVSPLASNMMLYLGNAPAQASLEVPSAMTVNYRATPLPYLPNHTQPTQATGAVANPTRLFGKGLTTYQTHLWEGETAMRQPYSPVGLYAAHRFLPFGAKVRVVNTRNGKSVVVEINDRGPIQFPERIIDLNHEAGMALDMGNAGKVEAELYVLTPIPEYYYHLPFNFEAWTIQVSSSSSERWAQNYARKLGTQASVVPFRLPNGSLTYRVFYGRYGARTQVRAMIETLKARGVHGTEKYLLEEHYDLIDFRPYKRN